MKQKFKLNLVSVFFMLICIVVSNCSACFAAYIEHNEINEQKVLKENLYVSLSGDDSNPGTAVAPLRNIQTAVNVATDGQTIVVSNGNYDEYITINNSGLGENERIILCAETEHSVSCRGFNIRGDFITLDGFRIEAELDHWIGVYINRGNYVTIKNCLIEECPGGGIFALATEYTNIVDNIITHNGQRGIELIGSYGSIERNEISTTVQYHPKGIEPGSKGMDADGLRIFGDHHMIIENRVLNPGDPADSGNIDPHPDCLQTWDEPPGGRPIMTDSVIENNYFQITHPAGKGIIIESTKDDVAHGIIIRNNIIEFRDEGIALSAGEHYDIFIYNNLLKANLYDSSWGSGDLYG